MFDFSRMIIYPFLVIPRKKDIQEVKRRLKTFPVVALLGARQCGKTTLAKLFPYKHYFDLESPQALSKLDNPQLALESLEGLIVIDEIQRKPELFPLLRFLVDQKKKQKFLILGSASRDLIKQSSETLAGRIAFYHLSTFGLKEVGLKSLKKLWLRGGFPLSFLSKSDENSELWRENYISTFLERDIPQLGIQIPSHTLRRFWIMLSHYHGQTLNYSEFGRSFGVSDMTVRKYIDLLAGTFMVRLLQPWFVNIGKRLIKSPKIYIRDSGLFHTLQTIKDFNQLSSHPKLGASWEGFALESVAQHLRMPDEKIFFWGTHGGAELDLFWKSGGKNWGADFKYTDAPRKTPSMVSSLKSLDLNHLWIVYPGVEKYELDKKITVLPISLLHQIPLAPSSRAETVKAQSI